MCLGALYYSNSIQTNGFIFEYFDAQSLNHGILCHVNLFRVGKPYINKGVIKEIPYDYKHALPFTEDAQEFKVKLCVPSLLLFVLLKKIFGTLMLLADYNPFQHFSHWCTVISKFRNCVETRRHNKCARKQLGKKLKSGRGFLCLHWVISIQLLTNERSELTNAIL